MPRSKFDKKGPALPAPAQRHPDEEAAVARAAAAGGVDAVTAHAIISTWVVERARRAAGVRLTSNLAFELGDARLRGFVEAALVPVSDHLTAASFDFGRPIVEMEKQEIIDLFVAAIQGAQASALAVGESELFAFDDPIPFGSESEGVAA